MTRYDPAELQVSAQPAGPKKWKWTLAVGNSAPVKTGIVTGARDDALKAGREERLRLISKGR